ncbi:hypothetical protein F5B21DRAFT_520959 [Xylaria acuta]|nr:hypothetical protein F5B21DRAFT_520959 [Xylaria acuta]
MAGKRGHRSKSSKSKGKGVDNSAPERIEPQPHSPKDRIFEQGQPKDPKFWHKDAATNTWNYVQSGTPTVFDDTPGPSTRKGDQVLDIERTRNIQVEEYMMTAYNTAQQGENTQRHDRSRQRDHGQQGTSKRRARRSSQGESCCIIL